MKRAKRQSKQKRAGKNGDLLGALMRTRDTWRTWQPRTKNLVRAKNLRAEWTRQGKIAWYLHPLLKEYSVRNLLIFSQEIPPGSRSGKQKHPGGLCHYILEGKGHTVVDGESHEWEAGDAVVLPIRPNGITYQHFNSSPTSPVRFIAGMPNWTDALGVDLGSRWEQLEDAPEYGSRKSRAS